MTVEKRLTRDFNYSSSLPEISKHREQCTTVISNGEQEQPICARRSLLGSNWLFQCMQGVLYQSSQSDGEFQGTDERRRKIQRTKTSAEKAIIHWYCNGNTEERNGKCLSILCILSASFVRETLIYFFKKLQLITNCHETKLFAKRTKTWKSYDYVPCAGEFSPAVVMRWHFFRPCALKHPAARDDIGISFNKTYRLV